MKKCFINLLLSAVLCYACAGCMALPHVPGETIAGGVLQSDVLRFIAIFECSLSYCDPPTVVDTKLISLDSASWTADRMNSSSWMELWVVDRKGTLVEYEILFTSTPFRGGTDFSVKLK